MITRIPKPQKEFGESEKALWLWKQGQSNTTWEGPALPLLALQMGKGAMIQGQWAASSSWKWQRNWLSLTLDSAPVMPCHISNLTNCNI
jgi:hypothetical protein